MSQATPFVTRPPAPQHRPNITILVVPCLFVIVTFLFWYQTWFGRQLSPQEMQQSLTDTSVPHKTQHALSQMADRMSRGDAKVRRWYPQVLALARNREPLLRLTAAWVMGQDNGCEEFHQTLVGLLRDPDARVQWNAALALVRFGDASGDPQLRMMLGASTLKAPQSGVLQFKLKPGGAFRAGTVVAHIRTTACPLRCARPWMENSRHGSFLTAPPSRPAVGTRFTQRGPSLGSATRPLLSGGRTGR